jgi:predicted ATPase
LEEEELVRNLIVLLGVHGAGKTTFGSSLPVDRFAFYGEIGTQLRAEVDFGVTSPQEDFDREVMLREVQRDHELLAEPRIPVVETWHIGNLAFALARGSNVIAMQYRQIITKQLANFDVVAMLFTLQDDEFLSRVTEKKTTPSDALRFYRKVAQYQHSLLDEYLGSRSYVVERPWSPEHAPDLLADAIRDRWVL